MTLRLTCAAFLAALIACPAGALGKPPRVLATGDSMIESVAAGLERSLERRGEARLVVDAQPASGISKPWQRDWLDYAPFQVRRDRPRATVMMVGANEGYPMLDARGREVACCRRAWIDAYALAAADMMASYAAGGRRVYWLTLPGPRDRARLKVFAAVNAALVRAARRGDRVRLVDLVARFTPGYRYRRAIRVDGRRRLVRARDGIHLNRRGGAVAARMVQRALRADGVIR
jgi:hypothetical protein